MTSALTIGMSVVSAAGKIKAGRAERDRYRREADLVELKGRTEAIAYKQKGADILSNLNNTLAAIIARSAAGGVDPTSGSAAVLATASTADGITEANIAADNAILAVNQASEQADIYRKAGDTAYKSSVIGAIGTIGTGAYRYGQLTG